MRHIYLTAFAAFAFLSSDAQEKIQKIPGAFTTHPVDLVNQVGPVAKPSKVTSNQFKTEGVETIPLGSSSNVFTAILAGNNQVSYNPDLNAIGFIHRENGNSGNLRYDLSLDGGTSWDVDQGPLTPEFDAGNAPQAGAGNRYPNLTIWNPDGNTDPNNAFLVGHGPALSDVTGTWGNTFEVSARLDGSDVSENYVDLTGGDLQSFHPYGLVSANGSVWSLSTSYNTGTDVLADTMVYRDFYLNRGTFNDQTNSFDWVTQEIWSPNWYRTDITGNGAADNYASNWGVNFSPDGQTGYAVITGAEISEIGLDTIPHPVVYKTSDGGDNWSKLPEFDFSTLQIFQDYLFLPEGDDQVRPFFSDMDMAVDADGRLHVFYEMLSGFGGTEEDLTFIFADLTSQYLMHGMTTDGTDWEFEVVSNVINNGDGVVGAVGVFLRLQCGRSEDGNFIFFTWNEDDDNESINFPNIMARGYSVENGDYSEIENLTLDSDAEDFAFWQSLSPVVITNGECFTYELPIVFGEPSGSDLNVLQFYYLKNAGFNYPWGTINVSENELDSKVSLYPNPSNGWVTLEAPTNWDLEISVYDTQGKLVESLRKTNAVNRLDFSALDHGMYFVEIAHEGDRITRKLIIE